MRPSPVRPIPPALAILAVLALGCAGPEPQDALQLVQPRLPLGVAGEGVWQYSRTAAADFNGDGTVELAVIMADVEIGTDGAPLWDHGHHWQGYIEEPGGNRTFFYARFLPNGRLDAALAWPADGPPTILLTELTPQTFGVYEVFYGGAGAIVSTRLAERELRRGTGFIESRP